MEFAEKIRAAMAAQDLTQQEVADRMATCLEKKFSQPSVSSLLANPPTDDPANDKRIQCLAKVLKLKLKDLVDAIAVQDRETNSQLSGAQGYVREANHDLSIWAFNPQHLALIDDPEAKAFWAANLKNGISYHLVWTIVDADRHAVARIAAALRQVAELVGDDLLAAQETGRVEHILVRLESDNDDGDRVAHDLLRKSFQSTRDDRDSNLKQLCRVSEVRLDQGEYDDLDKVFMPLGSTVLYLPNATSEAAPQANVRLPQVRMNLTDKESGQLLWLCDDVVQQLVALASTTNARKVPFPDSDKVVNRD